MSTHDLSKMGVARVSVEELEGVNCVLKKGASEVEINFYLSVAPNLVSVNTPALLKLDGSDLFIEYIPNPITLKELQLNTKTFEQLASIHSSQHVPSLPVKNHEWTNVATGKTVDLLFLSKSEHNAIKSIQSLSHSIFEYPALISGDSNDGNWRTRANGELVLFDWERFGYGSPAIDLAPLVSGLGTVSEYESIIKKYTQHSSLLSETELMRHLIIAKCWIVTEVVNILIERHNPDAGKYINWYRKNVPQWLASVESAL
ncbi:choline kinase [Vibrio sp. vnigr-6D03]|uniref:phosphotransferase family protein n=1 Tax=Vibrio sp. vnigr-6D03 TaxID=2058088 RepID=UPI000C331EA3|nr:choline kinase [Vibrio sp. vnigr-6D03]PKF76263.1 choline kinase [Vibrio sp. vnigr-6D03]